VRLPWSRRTARAHGSSNSPSSPLCFWADVEGFVVEFLSGHRRCPFEAATAFVPIQLRLQPPRPRSFDDLQSLVQLGHTFNFALRSDTLSREPNLWGIHNLRPVGAKKRSNPRRRSDSPFARRRLTLSHPDRSFPSCIPERKPCSIVLPHSLPPASSFKVVSSSDEKSSLQPNVKARTQRRG